MSRQPPVAPVNPPPRHCQEPLPPYRFIPGVNSHPARNPGDHASGSVYATPVWLPPERWRDNRAYLYGVDLYNRAYWWESHEVWENLWRTTNKDQACGQFLQGLIQVSAAFIKWYSQRPEGLIRLYQIGYARLCRVKEQSTYFMGIDLDVHLKRLQSHFEPVLSPVAIWPDPFSHYPFLDLTPDISLPASR